MNGRVYPAGWPIDSDWTGQLDSHFQEPGFQELCAFVDSERRSRIVYPTPENVFAAFRLTSFAATKVVILGQDPYHGPNQAHGLSFSVESDTKVPPSLKNIYREMAVDLGVMAPTASNLTAWAKQGVLLLNTVLTVRQGEPNSHRKHGWERFTDEVIARLNSRANGVVFILWGKLAERKTDLIDGHRHIIITAPHPSPLSAHRGFFGSRPFSRTNAALQSFGRSEIDWTV
jgi:uracil-DNA glycosylase